MIVFKHVTMVYYTDISCLGWVFAKNTSLITPYVRMLDSDWLIAVIFFLQIQALDCEFAEFLLHVGVFA